MEQVHISSITSLSSDRYRPLTFVITQSTQLVEFFFILTMDQINTCNVTGVAHSDKPTEKFSITFSSTERFSLFQLSVLGLWSTISALIDLISCCSRNLFRADKPTVHSLPIAKHQTDNQLGMTVAHLVAQEPNIFPKHGLTKVNNGLMNKAPNSANAALCWLRTLFANQHNNIMR